MLDKQSLLQELVSTYTAKHKKSAEIFRTSSQFQTMGGSHNLRLFFPFPFYDIQCQGSEVRDVDGNSYVDFWQGHFANILGHNPRVVLETLQEAFNKGEGLLTGFPGILQSGLAQKILERISADQIRFTTSGTLATMYAIMLSKSYTQKELVMKVGGGWHGSQPYTLKGISVYDHGLNQMESAGLPLGIEPSIIMTRFNDIDDLEAKFRVFGHQISCLIIEPFIGAGGFLFGQKEYLKRARELTVEYNSLLIFDEVISGFRFHAGALHSLYGIRPDLTVLGKAIGGGMPVSAVAGQADVMELMGSGAPPSRRVKFEGGTFSAHPAAMLAGSVFLDFLVNNESEIYGKIGSLGDWVRGEIKSIFNRFGIPVSCTGGGSPLGIQSSLIGVHFLSRDLDEVTSPEQAWNPEICDIDLREKIFKLAMLNEGFNVFHGYGAISFAHSKEEIQASLDAIERIARKWSS